MAGSPLHLECVYIGSLTHPSGDRPSHPISVHFVLATRIGATEVVSGLEDALVLDAIKKAIA